MEAEFAALPGLHPIAICWTATSALFGTAMIPHTGAGSRGGDCRGAHPLFVVDPAEMGAPHEKPRRSSVWRTKKQGDTLLPRLNF